jgi:hypothetical protein
MAIDLKVVALGAASVDKTSIIHCNGTFPPHGTLIWLGPFLAARSGSFSSCRRGVVLPALGGMAFLAAISAERTTTPSVSESSAQDFVKPELSAVRDGANSNRDSFGHAGALDGIGLSTLACHRIRWDLADVNFPNV